MQNTGHLPIVLAMVCSWCIPARISAQCENYTWAQSGKGEERDESYALDTDDAGNIYFAGWFDSDSLRFDPGVFTLNSSIGQNGNGDAFLAKFDPSGLPIWVKSAGGASNSDWCWAMAALPDGGAVIVGEFYSSTMLFGPGISLSRTGLSNAFIARYDGDGNALWARKFGVNGTTTALGVAIGPLNRIYVTGNFEESAPFAGSTLTSLGSDDLFVLAYEEDGTELWASSVGGPDFVSGLDIATSAEGDIYVSGRSFSPTLTFAGSTESNAGAGDFFVLHYTSDGLPLGWLYVGGTDNEEAQGLAVGIEGSVYVGGAFWSSTLSIGPFTLTNEGQWDAFIARLDADLNPVWVESGGGSSGDRIEELDVAADGSVWGTGSAGSSPGTYGSFSTTGAGVLLVGYTVDGAAVWAEQFSGSLSSFDQGTSIAMASDGNVLIGGRFLSPTIDLGGGTVLTHSGAFATAEVFLSRRRNPTGIVLGQQPVDTTVCEGQPVAFSLDFFPDRTYHWYRDGTLLPGEIFSVWSRASVSSGDVGTYTCLVSDSCDAVWSNPAMLGVLPTPDQPVIQLAPGGDSLTASGAALNFLWILDGDTLPYVDQTIPLAGSGVYQVIGYNGTCYGMASEPFQFNSLQDNAYGSPASSLPIWPNPGNDVVWIAWPGGPQGEVSWVLYGPDGRRVLEGLTPVSGTSLTIRTGELPAGVYHFLLHHDRKPYHSGWVVR